MPGETRYVMLKERMEHLQLPLLAMLVWTFGGGAAGVLTGGGVGFFMGLALGALVGAYAAFGRSWLAIALRIPAVAIAYGLSFLHGSR